MIEARFTPYEIASTPQEADVRLKQLFTPEIDTAGYDLWLRPQYEWLADNHPYLGMATIRQEYKDKNKGLSGTIVLASGSDIKLRIVEGVALDLGYNVLAIDPESIDQTETRAHLELQKNDSRYTSRVARAKLDTLAKIRNDPVLAMDTVVRTNGTVLEKPTDKLAAVDMIKATSGNLVEAITAVSLLQYTKSGRHVLTQQSVRVSMKLDRISDDRAQEYVDANQDTILNIAGGIDYSHLSGRLLIDPAIPIDVSLENLYNGNVFERFDFSRNVLLNIDSIPAINTYFQGAPRHLVSALISHIGPVYQGL